MLLRCGRLELAWVAWAVWAQRYDPEKALLREAEQAASAALLLAAVEGIRLVHHRMPWAPREQDLLDWGLCWAECLRDRPRFQLGEERRGPRPLREVPLYRWQADHTLLEDSRPCPLHSRALCFRLIGQCRAYLVALLQVAAVEEQIPLDWERPCLRVYERLGAHPRWGHCLLDWARSWELLMVQVMPRVVTAELEHLLR